MSFQENLKFYREKAGYKSAREVAEALSLPYNTYAGYESKGREPKFNVLCKIADLLNVSTDELLGRENNILGMNEDERLKKEINDLLIASSKNDMSSRTGIHCINKLVDVTKEYFIFDGAKIDKSALIDYINKLKAKEKENTGVAFFKFINHLWFLKYLYANNIDKLDEKGRKEIEKFKVIANAGRFFY